MTRAYTIRGRQAGYDGVLSVGRVQTPVLGLIVRRDLEIENFQPKDFYEVLAWVKDEKTSENPTALFSALWQPSKACEDYQDEDGRVLSLGLAENVVKRITDQPAEVTEYVDKREKETAPEKNAHNHRRHAARDHASCRAGAFCPRKAANAR